MNILYYIVTDNYVKIIPGAAKSVKFGSRGP